MEKLDELSRRLIEIRNERRDIKAMDKALSEEFDEITQTVKSILEEMGVEATRTAYATLSLNKKIVPSVHSWDEFEAFVKKRDALFLFQRRVSAAAWQEMRELVQAELGDDSAEVPGTEAFEMLALNVRAK